MNEFDAIAFIVDTAIKHARHNQKLHGRRGSKSGGAYTQTAMDFGGGFSGDGTPTSLPVAADGIDPSTWKAHKPSDRALALVREFAAMADNPSGRFARIQDLKNVEKDLQEKTAAYLEARKKFHEARAANAPEPELRNLADTADSLLKASNRAVNAWLIAASLTESGIVQLDPRLALRAGSSDIIRNDARKKADSANRKKSLTQDQINTERELADITDKSIAAFHSITGSEDPFRGASGTLRVDPAYAGGAYSKSNNSITVGLNGIPGNQNMSSFVVHEMTHFAEFRNRKMLEATSAFYDARTVGEKTRPLNEVWAERTGRNASEGPYPMGVYGRGDKFPTLYSGREYRSITVGRETTEILSTGVELLMTDPVGFAKADPEYFTFVVDTMQSSDMYGWGG